MLLGWNSHESLVGVDRLSVVAHPRDADSISSAIAEMPADKFDSQRQTDADRYRAGRAQQALLAQAHGNGLSPDL